MLGYATTECYLQLSETLVAQPTALPKTLKVLNNLNSNASRTLSKLKRRVATYQIKRTIRDG